MKATIDRIEGGIAVLVSREDETVRIQVPVRVLPVGSREGDILSITLERDDVSTAGAKAETASLIGRLTQR
jgi:Protein of unknown function (DUF3006)